MRIEYLTAARLDEPTAPAHHVLGLARALAAKGHRIHLLHPGPPIVGAQDWLHGESIHAYPRMRGGWRLFERGVASNLRRKGRTGETEILYLRFPPSRRVAEALKPLASFKVLEIDGTEPLRHPRFGRLLEAVDLVLGQEGQEAALRRALSKSTPFALDKLAIHLHPATDPDHFRPLDRSACRSRLGLPREARLLLHVSTFQAHHDVATAIEALRRLAGDREDVRLILAGDGPGRRAARKAARDLVRSGRVRMPGFVSYDELPFLIGAADACLNLCQPAKLEEGNVNGFKCLEYLACARPVVESVHPGLPVPDWAAGVLHLVPPAAPEAVAAAVRDIQEHPAEWAKRCAAGRRHVQQRRTWEHAAESTLERIEAARRADSVSARPAGC